MKVKMTLEIEKCNNCPYHEIHDICTADSFENETGIYCGKTEDSTDSWERHTNDGRIDKRLIYSYDTWEPSEAPVPTWCPILIEQYKEVEDKLRAFLNDNGINLVWYTQIYSTATRVLEMLEESKFKGFFYHARFQPTERDRCLVVISTLYKAALCDASLDLELSDEDMKIIKSATEKLKHSANGQDLLDSFNAEKEERRDTIYLPALKTEIAVPMAILLARRLMGPIEEPYVPIDMYKKIEFSLISQEDSLAETAELRYIVDKKRDTKEIVDILKRGDNPDYVLIPRFVAKEILGLKYFDFYINDEKIPITKFTNMKH